MTSLLNEFLAQLEVELGKPADEKPECPRCHGRGTIQQAISKPLHRDGFSWNDPVDLNRILDRLEIEYEVVPCPTCSTP